MEAEIPPHSGIGGDDDSLQSVLTLHPKPVRKAKGKYMPNRPGATNDTLALHFSAKLVSAAPVDAEREFIITFHLADDTISIYENARRNGGFKGGEFLMMIIIIMMMMMMMMMMMILIRINCW